MSQWKITTPPAQFPITTKQALNQCGIDDIEPNRDMVNDAIDAATAYAETSTQLSLITRTITAIYYPEQANMTPLAIPFPPYTNLPIFRGPIQAITAITDEAGNDISEDYILRKVGFQDFVQLQGSIVGPVSIVYTAGYGDDPADVPADIRRAITAHTAHLFRFHEADADANPKALEYVYEKYRTGGVG